MAILKSIQKQVFGEEIIFENAYHRIETLERRGNEVAVKLVSYKNETCSVELEVNYFTYELTGDDENSLELGYSKIKEHGNYADAVDI